MKQNSIFNLRCLFLLPILIAAATAQVPPSDQSAASPPVPYSSISQLNLMLSQLEPASQAAQVDLAKLRIEKWKADSSTKRQLQADVDSIERNLQAALPQIIAELRTSPENLTSTFKLYRNLDALYDVFGTIVESAGAFGSKDEFKMLESDLSEIERSRKSFADRMETLAGSKEVELTRLRTALQSLPPGTNPLVPKKVIVDDTEPPKKPARKKASSTKPNTTPAPPQPQTQPH
jgi:hypothetical protein